MINVKIKGDLDHFFNWLKKKIDDPPLTLQIHEEVYYVEAIKEKMILDKLQITFYGISEKKIDFYNYIDDFSDEETDRIIKSFPENEYLAIGNIIDLGTQGFEIDFQVLQPGFRKTLNSLIDEAQFFWQLSKHDYRAEYFESVEKKTINESGWVSEAFSMYIDGKSPKEITEYLNNHGVEVVVKTVRNEITKLRNKLGEETVPRKAERDRRLALKPTKK